MKKNKIQAFTIVETLITLLAITIMIAGPLTFMYKSYQYAGFIKSRIVSTGLAQEGLELATSLRNNNLADFKTAADNCANGCMADWDGQSPEPTFTPCTNEDCKLYQTSSDVTQMYRATGDKETGQYRYVKFTPFSSSNNQGYTVESIAWSDVGTTKVSADLKKLIFNIATK